MSTEKRTERREKVYAKILLLRDNTPGYLRDLSRSGGQLSFIKPIAVQKEDALAVHIIPGAEIGIPDFKIFFEVLWTQDHPAYFAVGGRISPIPGDLNDRRLEALFDYYAEMNSE